MLTLTGARLGEAERLQRQHIDFERGVRTIPGTKTKLSCRTLPFSELPELVSLLKHIVAELPAEEQHLFSWTSAEAWVYWATCDLLN